MTQRTRLAHPWPPWVDASSFSSNIDTNTRKNTLALGRARGTAEAAICEGCEAHDLREMLRRARRSMAKIRPRPRFVNPLPLVFSGRATIARGVMRLPARPHRLLGASPTDRPTTSPWPTRSAPWHRDRRPVRARSTEHMYLCVQVDRRACRVAMATGPDDKLRPTHRQTLSHYCNTIFKQMTTYALAAASPGTPERGGAYHGQARLSWSGRVGSLAELKRQIEEQSRIRAG